MTYRVQWSLDITANSSSEYEAALAKVKADAERRRADHGEEWTVTPNALTRHVHAQVVIHTADLDAAG